MLRTLLSSTRAPIASRWASPTPITASLTTAATAQPYHARASVYRSTVERAEDVPMPAPGQYVSDMCQIIDPQSFSDIQHICRRMDETAGVEVVVVTCNVLEGWFKSTRSIAKDIYYQMGVGQHHGNAGVLFVLAANLNRLQVETGVHITDTLDHRFMSNMQEDLMVPHFMQQQYGAGLREGVIAVERRIAEMQYYSPIFHTRSHIGRGSHQGYGHMAVHHGHSQHYYDDGYVADHYAHRPRRRGLLSSVFGDIADRIGGNSRRRARRNRMRREAYERRRDRW